LVKIWESFGNELGTLLGKKWEHIKLTS